MKKLFILFLLVPLTFIASCNKKEKEQQLTKETAMQKFLEMSPERGAYFYAKNRTTYTFLDSFYQDSVFPAVFQCNYKELKSIAYSLKGTPLQEVIYDYFSNIRTQFLNDIYLEISTYSNLQKQLFETEILPLMEMELDSMLTADMEDLIDKYAGGFLNYRKLEFFFGKDSKEFEKLWNENINSKSYNEHMNKYICAYLDSISEFQKQYFHSITGRNINKELDIEVSPIELHISNDILKQVDYFTSKETMTMTSELIKDYAAPIVVGITTGGIGSLIYEIGNTAYDVTKIYNDIKNQTVEPEEQLLSICVEELSNNIRNEYLQECNQNVADRIEGSNEILYNLITLSL